MRDRYGGSKRRPACTLMKGSSSLALYDSVIVIMGTSTLSTCQCNYRSVKAITHTKKIGRTRRAREKQRKRKIKIKREGKGRKIGRRIARERDTVTKRVGRKRRERERGKEMDKRIDG